MPGRLTFWTTADGASAPTERMRIDRDGNVGIGGTPTVFTGQNHLSIHSPGSSTNVAGIDLYVSGTRESGMISYPSIGESLRIFGNTARALTIHNNGSERMRIDSSGKLLVGTSTSVGNGIIQAEATSDSVVHVRRNTTALTSGPALQLRRSYGTALNSFTAVPNNGNCGYVQFLGSDGSADSIVAQISAFADGASSLASGDTPGRLVFSTTADGSSSPTERMRITSSNFVNIGTQGTDIIWNQTSVKGVTLGAVGVIQAARDSDQLMLLNRITNDGVLVTFAQDGVVEGNISVSGTTVSYNGAHLSRWSQLPGGATREEILRGTVLSNIDEMCAWGDEDNEQLNRMKVSDVEGDRNVSGVFQAWDDDDDIYTDDFYCAMTGDFIIRIAQGVTVERGDLLMSAGDGTAKPQDDDIVRSKTIAKVTSTHVTCTYDDGSYCVPCVLMAC